MSGEHPNTREALSTDRQLHTPGPWIQFAIEGRTVAICPAGRDGDICELDDDRPHAESDANARLIAAAPDLLAALKYLQRHYVGQLENARDRIVQLGGQCDPVDVMERGDPHLRQVRAVIAKATGEHS